ncbi:MAG: RNA 2',3'-cyclic phosphodiesterase [Myxococcota bacterium]|jgi:2'-5' RNA ligase|nr:RNA 2',3'-cyclic phosphodiesterase [Myxococcota bacterium]
MADVSRQRCFVALPLPDPVLQACLDAQHAVRALSIPGTRYTAPQNLHLTLKFLGEIPAGTVAEVRRRLGEVRAPVVGVRVEGAGCFAPRILWLKLEGADALQQEVDHALEGLFEPERRFMGHVTIARTRRLSRPHERAVRSLEIPQVSAPVSQFSLQRSHLGPEGPRYELLQVFALG